MEKWKDLSLLYMTEESDDPDNPNGQVSWNTNFYGALKVSEQGGFNFVVLVTFYPVELNDFVAVLESREHKMPSGMVAKKVRRDGSPSRSVPLRWPWRSRLTPVSVTSSRQ